ncbi:MAG TPA: thioredoxin domain-containing protein [Candidatus Binataceae bacterium]|nr:thioredoxin domain-containing protein [Candidatus Binataceae bacterium]
MKLGRSVQHRNFFLSAGLAAVLAAILFTGASPSRAFAGADDKVVATVGDHQITESQLDARIKPQMASLESKIYDLKRQALEMMAGEFLIEQAAQRANLSLADYLKKEVGDKVTPATEAEARKYYDDHKQQITQPYDKVKIRIISGLTQQRVEVQRAKLVTSLLEKSPVKILLPAPRVQVASAGHPESGGKDAPVTIVEFADFQCPFCRRAEDVLKDLRAKYGDKIKLVYMDFPLPMHDHALDAAKAALCADEQGKFWAYHDDLYANQSKLAPADLKAYAKQLGLDTAKFNACFDKAKFEAHVRRDLAEGSRLGVDGTPSFFIDGRPLIGVQPLPAFEQIIDEELAASGQARAAPH